MCKCLVLVRSKWLVIANSRKWTLSRENGIKAYYTCFIFLLRCRAINITIVLYIGKVLKNVDRDGITRFNGVKTHKITLPLELTLLTIFGP